MEVEPMGNTVLKQGNSSLSAFAKGIFIGMKKDFNSVRRYNISHIVLLFFVKDICVCVVSVSVVFFFFFFFFFFCEGT